MRRAGSVLPLPGCSFDFRRRFRRLMGYLNRLGAFVFRVGSARVINAAA
jgi:hypothetical protein